jgi:hypothetical protein
MHPVLLRAVEFVSGTFKTFFLIFFVFPPLTKRGRFSFSFFHGECIESVCLRMSNETDTRQTTEHSSYAPEVRPLSDLRRQQRHDIINSTQNSLGLNVYPQTEASPHSLGNPQPLMKLKTYSACPWTICT